MVDAETPGGSAPRRAAVWLKPDDRDHGADRAWLVSWAATLTAGLAVAMLAVSPVISWLTRSTGSLGTIAHFLGFGARPSWSLRALAGLIAAVAAVARYCQAGLAKWTASTSAANANSAAAPPGLLTRLAGRHPAAVAALAGQRRRRARRRGSRAAVDKRWRQGRILRRPARAGRRRAGRDAAPASP